MFLISTLLETIKNERNRRRMSSLCKNHGLNLAFPLSASELRIFSEVFFSRDYSCYFPFYQKATIVDIGAHKGFFSLFASLNLHPDSRIIALEPSSENFSALRENIGRNKSAVEAHRLGVAGTSGNRDLFLSTNENFSLFETYAGINGAVGKKYPSEKVDVVSFEDLVNSLELPQIDFLKLDCEGAEFPFLFEAPLRLFDRVKTISLEFHDLKRPEYSGNALAGFLKSGKFNIVKFSYAPAVSNNNGGKIVATKF
jgi:FkbM family methyltransferase